MTLENTNNPELDASINRETDRLLSEACRKHNLTPDQLPAGAVEDARRTAKDMIMRDEARKANPLFGELEQRDARIKALEMELAATRETRIAPHNDVKPVANVARVRGLMGEKSWHALTDSGRLAACGIPPSEVTPDVIQQARSLFGRGADAHAANDAFKRDAGRYRHLRNVAVILNLQGA